MTTGEGGPRVRMSGRDSGVSGRLREAIFAAHAEAVRAVAAAEVDGLAVNRDLIELIELQRRIIRIADQFADEVPIPLADRAGSAAISSVTPNGVDGAIMSVLAWPAPETSSDSRLRVIEDITGSEL
ncbi:hypothetical protein GFY24_18875 [Nocardia sp. SYP-A9097]|uniref:hypothetical protein n=1 Tax=Nocardia sp. SYP-A9097 TaxID=2663237 RepID=UPI00129B851B|nr:hypothetical protein [Nocardia sp. SYP-A9097]MRH89485.1 hypothetical protein [Nocardia sp. SYP-A9097]